MRPVHYGDVSAAARALTLVPPPARVATCRDMLARAAAARDYMIRTGRCHPFWGNGSLMAAARCAKLPPEPDFSDADYARCVETVLYCLRAVPSRRRRTRSGSQPDRTPDDAAR
jgi:hypothetical protein